MKPVIKMFACASMLLGNAGKGQTVSNSTPFIIPIIGAASPYPGTINVNGLAGTPVSVEVRLIGLDHSFPADLDILLVGPTGANVLLMSDAGTDLNISNVNLLFNDSAEPLPELQKIAAGTYRPTNYGGSADNFIAPAPDGPYGSFLSAFAGQDPNGPWRLFVIDQGTPDGGQLVGGWELTFSLSSGPAITYQGRLSQGGIPFSGVADFRFRLLNSASGQVGAVQNVNAVSVKNGLFTAHLNSGAEFGPEAFNGEERSLEVSVAAPPGSGITTLLPVQPITAAPHALYAHDSAFATEAAYATQSSSVHWTGILGVPPELVSGMKTIEELKSQLEETKAANLKLQARIERLEQAIQRDY